MIWIVHDAFFSRESQKSYTNKKCHKCNNQSNLHVFYRNIQAISRSEVKVASFLKKTKKKAILYSPQGILQQPSTMHVGHRKRKVTENCTFTIKCLKHVTGIFCLCSRGAAKNTRKQVSLVFSTSCHDGLHR